MYGGYVMKNKYLAVALISALTLSSQVRAEGKNGIAAVVNGENINITDIKDGYNANPQIKANVPFKDFYGKALDIFVNGKLVYQAAIADKITESPEYKKQLKIAQEDVARKIYLEKQVKAVVTDAKIKEAYNKYKAEFKSKKEVKARHILVSSESLAKEIITKLNKGEEFDALAKKHSKDKSIDLGYFTQEMMVPEFGKTVFGMKKGQISKKPIKTQFGYHVAIVDDVRDSKPLEFKVLRPQLEGMLTQQEVAKIFQNLVKKAKIEKYSLDGKVIK